MLRSALRFYGEGVYPCIHIPLPVPSAVSQSRMTARTSSISKTSMSCRQPRLKRDACRDLKMSSVPRAPRRQA
ncbi:MAG: hypothetical protein OXF06_01435 [Bacteroidetes bacterium]|nr:hypothetical protein [Bacteroidota bacterium]